MNPDKRALNKEHAKQSEGKKPRYFPRGVLEAVQKECLQRLATNFEALIRPVVAEEIERAITRVASQGRVPLQQRITESPARKFHLQFTTNPAARSFTGSNLEDEHGDTFHIKLIDANTGQPVTTGPESVATLEVVPLMGDFNTSEEQDWDAEEFEKHVAKGREGKGPLLVGELKVHLKRGVGTLGQMCFTDNSSVTRSKKFRLGVRAAQDHDCGLMSIREGKSQAFTVIDSRGKAYRKHDIPSPTDDVWRLRNIRKGGKYHTNLTQNRILTVKDFLYWLETRPDCLREVLGKMSEKAYQDTIDHAKKCALGEKIYIYPVRQPPYENLIFDPDCQVLGTVARGQYVGLEMIDGNEKVHVDGFVKRAYDNWETDVTQCAVQDLATAEEPSMIGAVDGAPAYEVEDVAAALQEDDDGSPGVDGTEHITGQGYVDGNGIAEQEQRSGFDAGSSSQLNLEPFDVQQMNIASIVEDIMWEYDHEEYGDPFQLFSFDDRISPNVGRWWLRIRTLVRCALFIRRAGFARHPQDLN